MYLTHLQIRRLLQSYSEDCFTDWFSVKTAPPMREGLYVVRWGVNGDWEMAEYKGKQWQTFVQNPKIVITLKPDVANALHWLGLTDAGLEGFDPLDTGEKITAPIKYASGGMLGDYAQVKIVALQKATSMYRVTHSESLTIVKMEGRFDFNKHRDFAAALKTALYAVPTMVHIDLGNVVYMDSAALGMLLISRDRAKLAGKDLKLANARGIVKQVLDIANFQKLFEFV